MIDLRKIGVQGSRQFRPSQVSNLATWHRSDLGITTDVSVNVSQWLDLSGNNKHLSQSTDAIRPAYEASSGPNSTPSVYYNGAHSLQWTSTVVQTSPMTVYAVYDTTAIAGDGYRIMMQTTGGTGPKVYAGAAADGTKPEIYWNATEAIYSTAVTAASIYRYRWTSSVSMGIRIGTGAEEVTAHAQSSLEAFNYLGLNAIQPLKARVQEVIVYAKDLSITEDANVTAYLKARYAL